MPRFAFARNGHEPGRPCSVRPGPAAGPRVRLRARRVRRAGELHARRERFGTWPSRPASQSGVSVLDLCCGIAGPGRFITRELGCSYLGVDSSSSAVEIARERAGDLSCRFEVARIPPIPPGPFDVVLLFETMLAFPDKETLLEEISRALRPGGRFAFTLEEGLPLTEAERERMPDADTVWLTPLPEMLTYLERVGLRVRWQEDHSQSHLTVANALIEAFAADARPSPGRSGTGHWRSCWPPTGSGATGCERAGFARSRSSPKRRRRQAEQYVYRRPSTSITGRSHADHQELDRDHAWTVRVVHRLGLHRRSRGALRRLAREREQRSFHTGRANGVAHPPQRTDDLRARRHRARSVAAAARSSSFDRVTASSSSRAKTTGTARPRTAS